ncbi:cardiotrophin-2 [Xenopus laevis]|uniref:Cardiotrophin-2 n=1 Tax=Xenopus laevis TaxID=8355 RepID=A0A8J1LRX0_XENLA|nr:cardiotrophin-2 [Xenopus laevis]
MPCEALYQELDKGPFVLLIIFSHSLDTAPLPEEDIITKIQRQAEYLQNNATLLLNTYLQFQGSPFSNPGFSFPSWQEPGLPTASLGYKKWRCLCPGIRLLLARGAFSAISEFFQLVLDDQISLNPRESDLHRLLEEAKISSGAVLSNLASALEMLNFQSPSVEPDPWSWRSTGATSFQKKVRGYVLCREYKDWLVRLVKDMDILKGARVMIHGAGQEKKDCCRP